MGLETLETHLLLWMEGESKGQFGSMGLTDPATTHEIDKQLGFIV